VLFRSLLYMFCPDLLDSTLEWPGRMVEPRAATDANSYRRRHPDEFAGEPLRVATRPLLVYERIGLDGPP